MRELNPLQHIDPIKRHSKVVIRFVASFLKRNERRCYRYQVGLDRGGEKSCNRRGRGTTAELLAHFLHVGMDVSPPNLHTQQCGLGRRQPLRALGGEHMEQGIVGCRNGSS